MAVKHSTKKLNLVGKTFGRLTVIGLPVPRHKGKLKYVCLCQCGKEKTVRASHLMDGGTKSCGCLLHETNENNLMHGHARNGNNTSTYRSWQAMIQRCENKKSTSYQRYGGRGIAVCRRWLNYSFFLEDMGQKPKGLTLDRKDNSGNYEPGNCQWATPLEQNSNTRRNRHITLSGVCLTISEWSRKLSIHRETIRGRLNRGLTASRVLRPFTN